MVANNMAARSSNPLECASNIGSQLLIGRVVLIADSVAEIDDNIGAPFIGKIDKLMQQRHGHVTPFRLYRHTVMDIRDESEAQSL